MLSKLKYFKIMDQDSTFLNESLEQLLAIHEKHPKFLQIRRLYLASLNVNKNYGTEKRKDPREYINDDEIPFHDKEGELKEEDLLRPYDEKELEMIHRSKQKLRNIISKSF